MTFGRLVREARHAARESQQSVAHRAMIHPVHLSRIEKDHQEPGLFTALRIIRALGIDPEYLGDVVIGVLA